MKEHEIDQEELYDGKNNLSNKQKLFLEVLKVETLGGISKAAKQSGISRSTYYTWLKNEDFKREVEYVKLDIDDIVKNKLFESVLKGDCKSIILFLKTYGIDRGYF